MCVHFVLEVSEVPSRAKAGYRHCFRCGPGGPHRAVAECSGTRDHDFARPPCRRPDPRAPRKFSRSCGPRKYCVSCHNQKLNVAGLNLAGLDVDGVGSAADVWEKVARKFRTHEMPPAGRPRPDRLTYSAMASRIETALDNAAASRPNPGRVAVHRLNRVEYANSIRDLLGLEIDSRSLLPADDSNQESFDNIASVLSVSPVLLEGDLSAATRVSRLAVGDYRLGSTANVPDSQSVGARRGGRVGDDLPFGSQGGTWFVITSG